MPYISYQDIANHIGLEKGDRVFVSSDVGRLAFSCYANGETFNADLFIDSMIDTIGNNGTLVFPTYNWGFCKGNTFDYRKTPSKVGSLTNAALKRKDFKRTKHPIYSFAVWGKDIRWPRLSRPLNGQFKKYSSCRIRTPLLTVGEVNLPWGAIAQ